MIKKVLLIAIVLFSGQCNQLYAKVTLNALFSDHMVVQRETEMTMWGWADPNEKISINASWGASAETVANSDSTWSVKLKTPEAGGPFTITISGENTIFLNDVLSGEVWLLAGQSNMDHHMSTYLADAKEPQYQPLVDEIRNEINAANDTMLRAMVVPHKTSINGKVKNFEGEWISVSSRNTGKFSATGYYFGKELRKQLNVPIGLVECARGATRVQPWIGEKAYRQNSETSDYFDEELQKARDKIAVMEGKEYEDKTYKTELKAWKKNGMKGRKPRTETHPNDDIEIPANFYNGMVAPIVGYSIKGCIWYQGESNSSYMTDSYEAYFTTLINSWRADWGQGAFPFYWAQLSAWNKTNDDPLDYDGWASINDQQRRTLKVANTGMAVTYDIGEAEDIHPHNKMDVGKRLALLALKNDYHFENIVCSGPLYKSHKIENGKVEIIFDNVGSGLMVGKKVLNNPTVVSDTSLNRFQIAGKEGKWKWAKAEITSENKIIVWHDDIPEPTVVRYAWSRNPKGANLYNKEGLPASVFSTKE
jgi:sialate O-acetylesterase